MIQAVHFQFMEDGGELAKKLFSANRQIIALIVSGLLDKDLKTLEGEYIFNRIHSSNLFYPDWAIKIFKENASNPDVIWMLEGYRHCCGRCFNECQRRGGKSPDPFHEYICADGYAQTFGEQAESIFNGKNLVSDKLGISIVGHCSPNHLDNQDTLGVLEDLSIPYHLTRNGFDYFTKGLVKLPAYRDGNLIILPESKYDSSPVKMTYYDRMSEQELDAFLTSPDFSQRLGDLQIVGKPKIKAWMNERAIKTYKKLRDVVNSFL